MADEPGAKSRRRCLPFPRPWRMSILPSMTTSAPTPTLRSARLMGKAIDALHDALVELAKDGSKFLDEDFMNNIFSEIDEDENHNKRPL